MPRKWNPQSLVLGTSNKLKVTPNGSINLLGIKEQTSDQARENENNMPTSLDQRVKKGSQVNTIMKDQSIRTDLILTKHIIEEIKVQSVVILNTLKVSIVLQASINAEFVRDMDNFQTCVIEGQSLSSPEHHRCISCKLD